MEAQWQHTREAEWKAQYAADEAREEAWLRDVERSGITVGDAGLDVVGESFYLPALVSLVDRYPSGVAIAKLEREPSNPHDRNAIRVLIDEVQVGHLSRDDAEEYQPLLRTYEKGNRPLYLLAELNGGQLEADGMRSAVGVCFPNAPDPD